MFKKPRGTRDFLADEMAKRRSAEQVLKATFESFGYKEIGTPTFENLDLVTRKSGEGIMEHLYCFKDKGGRDIALRPELTAPVMRLYVNELQKTPKPVKLYYFGNCFRYERPQAGRYREFWQAGIELIGTDRAEGEAEVIAVAFDVLKNLGLKDFELHIGHIGILRAILEESEVPENDQNAILNAIDKGDKEGLEGLLSRLEVLPENREKLLKTLELTGPEKEVLPEAYRILEGSKALEELKRFETILDLLGVFDMGFKVNLGIARGLDYYTGTVFEMYANKLGAEKQICGGGTYSLVETFGGEKTATCGFAFGFDRLLLALEQENKKFQSESKTKFVVVPTDQKLLKDAMKIAVMVRKFGPCEIDLMGRKLKKVLAYASTHKIPFVFIVGEEELKKGMVILKNMGTGEQREVEIEGLTEGR